MEKVRVKIEIPHGSVVKYEFNKETGIMEVDRIVDIPYPFNYGFVKDTMWYDGDPLDVILLGQFKLHPGVELEAEPVAVIAMSDHGVSDAKLVCRISNEEFKDYAKNILTFLKVYKDDVEVHGYTTTARNLASTIKKAKELEEIK